MLVKDKHTNKEYEVLDRSVVRVVDDGTRIDIEGTDLGKKLHKFRLTARDPKWAERFEVMKNDPRPAHLPKTAMQMAMEKAKKSSNRQKAATA